AGLRETRTLRQPAGNPTGRSPSRRAPATRLQSGGAQSRWPGFWETCHPIGRGARPVASELSPDRRPCQTGFHRYRGVRSGSMPPIRRLPVLQGDSTSDDDRPAWHWVVIGFLFAFSIWAPLAMLASWGGEQIVRRILGDLPPDELGLELAQASSVDRFWLWFGLTGAPIVAYTFSCWAAGALVGRFGGKAGPKEAARAGGLAALAGAGLTLFRASAATSTASLLILVPLGVG